MGDLAKNAIATNRKYRVLISDPKLSWVDSFNFGPDGYLYAFANQFHRSAILNGGNEAAESPYLIPTFKPLSKGLAADKPTLIENDI